jgi:hypothetical protein
MTDLMHDGASNPKPKRPASLTAAAILLILFGLYTTFGGVLGVTMMMDPNTMAYFDELPSYEWFRLLGVLATLFIGILAVIAGRFVWHIKPVGRDLGITLAAIAMPLAVIQTFHTIGYVLPTINRIRDQQRLPDVSTNALIVLGFALVLSITVWGIIIRLLRSQSARNAFASRLKLPANEVPAPTESP